MVPAGSLLIVLLLAVSAEAETLEASVKSDFILKGGTDVYGSGLPHGLMLRSGSSGQNGAKAAFPTPSVLVPAAIVQSVSFSFRYMSGYGPAGSGIGANFTIRIAGVPVYLSPHLKDFAYSENRTNYSSPIHVNVMDLSVTVPKALKAPIEIEFDNNDRNLQLLLPLRIKVTCSTEKCSGPYIPPSPTPPPLPPPTPPPSPPSPPHPTPTGFTLVDVFRSGENGYSCFRIPSLLKLPSLDAQSLAVYAEARGPIGSVHKSCSDFAPKDLVYKISRDNGATWGNLTVLCNDGCSRGDQAYGNSTGQPAPIAVPASGSKPGYCIMLCNRGGGVYLSRSSDSLCTKWSNLSYTGIAQMTVGPTPGLVLPSGRMVISAHRGDGQALISDDEGVTWKESTGHQPGGNEGELALAPNGSLVMNSRWAHYRRILSWSEDDGETWSAPVNDSMPELGGTCEGSMVRVSQYGGGDPTSDFLLTASPWGVGPDWGHRCAGPGRCNMTVWASGDSGTTWDVLAQLNGTFGIDPRDSAAYSSMTQLNKTHFALLYERHNYDYLTMVYLKLPKRQQPQLAIV